MSERPPEPDEGIIVAADPEAEAEAAVEAAFEAEGEIAVGPRVAILMGSQSDMPTMQKAGEELDARNITYEILVMSAHRNPEVVAEFARTARPRGIKVIIAGAGLSAALPGVVAAQTDLPVIGVPLTSASSVAGGLDALLAIAQMPPGVPVACVAVNGARNAAVLAAKILDA